MAGLVDTSLYASVTSLWKMEDATDAKGVNNLTENNSPTYTAGRFGNAGDLGSSNTNKSWSKATNLGVNGNGDVSFHLWVKLLAEISSGTWEFFVHLSTGGADRYLQLSYDYNGGTRRLRVDPSGGTAITYNTTLGTSSFHHIVVTRNVAGNSCHLWLDNVDVANGTLGSTGGGGNNFYLGANSASDFSSALFDDCAFAPSVWGSTEVNTAYNSPVSTNGGAFLLNFV